MGVLDWIDFGGWMLAFALVLTASASPAATLESQRVALVIGNAAYRDAPLSNPVNDATDMAAVLRGRGFEVMLLADASLREMKKAARAFGARLRRDSVAVFYFSGHGVQFEGRNFLMPVGGRVDSADDLEFEAFDASFVLGQMEASRAAVNVVILDACRNMPLVRKHRGVRLGLRRMDGPRGSVIAYATSPGGVASDGEGRNGVYTKHLLQALRHKPHLPVTEMLIDVTASVMKETADRQVPWQSVSLTRRFCFSACAAQADPAPPPEVPAGPPPPASRSLVANVEASSTLPAQSDARGRLYTYEPHRALDGDARTAWVEGGDGHGVAQWLRVDFAREVTVSALDIIGRYKSDQNSRLARLEVELSDGSSREFVLEDSGEVQTLTLEARQRTRWVKLRILAVHPGTKWEDTPIAEVDFR